MPEKNYHRIFYRFSAWLVHTVLYPHFRVTTDAALQELSGPFLVVSNHVTDLDPFFVSGAFRENFSFVASEHVLHKGFFSRILKSAYDLIPIVKGKTALKTTKEIIGRLRKNRSVLIFPEGNRSFNGITMPVDGSCAKIAKIAGVPLVAVRIQGGYLTQPRWGKCFRKGKIHISLSRVYSPEELKEMDEAELSTAVNEGIYENAFETQKKDPVAFSGKRLAYGMESTLFMCPSCGKIGTMKSDDHHIFCRECAFSAEFDVYGNLTGDEKCPDTIASWDEWQKQALLESGITDFDDFVALYEIDDAHNAKKIYEGKLVIPEDLEGIGVYSRNVLILHAGGKHLEARGDDSFNALKYYYLYKKNR